MKYAFNLFAIATLSVSLIACKQASLKKTPGGMPYQIYSNPKQPKANMGGFLKISISQAINDSVVFTNRGKLPNYIPVLNQTSPYDLSELWAELHLGDSVIATQMMDTFINRSPGGVPAPFKKGDRIVTIVKVLGVYTNDSLRKIDADKELALFKKKEIDEVETFVKKNKVEAQRTTNGIFVQTLNPGTGNPIDSGKYVSVKYTGMNFEGKVFDSNVDTSFHHTDLLSFTVGAGQMIPGFDEGVRLLRQGGKGIFFIPSMQGYGAGGSGAIKGYDHLKFEVEVVSVADKAPQEASPGR